MANDMVDTMLEAVSGLDQVGLAEIGYESDEEVGRKVKQMAAARARGVPMHAAHLAPAPANPAARTFLRSSREVARRAPGGVPGVTLAAAIGDVKTTTVTLSRPVDISRLVLVATAAGAVLDSLKIGDEEQLLSNGVPVELYSSTLFDPRPDNFSTLPSGIPMTFTFRNTTAGAITVNIGFKGEVNR